MNRPLSGQMTMWCSPNPRNDFAEIILTYASSSGGAFPSKDSGKCLLRRQLQLRSQRRILTAFHPIRYNGIPFGQPQNPQYPIFKLCLPAIFIVLPYAEKSNSVFAISEKEPCSGMPNAAGGKRSLRFFIGLKRHPCRRLYMGNLLRKRTSLPASPDALRGFLKQKGGPAASGYGSCFKYSGRDPAAFRRQRPSPCRRGL